MVKIKLFLYYDICYFFISHYQILLSALQSGNVLLLSSVIKILFLQGTTEKSSDQYDEFLSSLHFTLLTN